MTRDVLSLSASNAFCISFSVTESKELVASSKTDILGFLKRQRAMLSLCFSPPDNLSPRSPTKVSKPSGCLLRKSVSCAFLQASSTSFLICG
mmetsp:Transcript_49458/g.41765  ORF Transcript_49458/g.41765 Transcript_49458/m.41765 type:complete len:92 (-) Transcript_49458:1582-1857(-)